MSKYKFSVLGFVAALVMAALIGGVANELAGAGVGFCAFALAFGVPMLKPFFPMAWGNTHGLSLMAIQVEVWQNHIEGNLFKDNEFLMCSTDAGQYVMQGKVVHIPQAGGTATVEKNRSSFPATASERTDTEVTYNLDAYTTDPILIRNAEVVELSYNKRESVIGEYEAALRQRIADEVLIKWAPTTSTRIIRTTGDDVETHLSGTSGYRKAITTSDLRKAQLTMNKQNVSKTDRYALFSADMLDQLVKSLSDTQYRDFSKALDEKTGVVGMLYGFKIMQRSDTVVYNAAATAVNAYGASVAADDNDAVICWQKDAVERAIGSITFFERQQDPLYFGDVYSFEVRMGGRIRRNDQKGLVAIVQVAS